MLAREGVEVELLANRLDTRPDGWRVRWRDETVCPFCGEACKRASIEPGGPFAYVGDGYSDRCVAAAAERVFATDGLADYLDDMAVPYERFGDLADVAQALTPK